MRRLLPRTALTLACVAFAAPAAAHIKLTFPTNRHAQDAYGDPQKAGPCGIGGAADKRSANVSTFKPGETVTVTWDETISHPGHFRILFDPTGQAFPDPKSYTDYDAGGAKTLVDNIPHASGAKYAQAITFPDLECDACTLQVIQVMTDKPPYSPGGNDIYYHCADIVLTRGATPSDGGAPSGTPGEPSEPSSPSDPSADGGARDAGGRAETSAGSGGCAAARGRGAGGAGAVAALAAALILARGRRRLERR